MLSHRVVKRYCGGLVSRLCPLAALSSTCDGVRCVPCFVKNRPSSHGAYPGSETASAQVACGDARPCAGTNGTAPPSKVPCQGMIGALHAFPQRLLGKAYRIKSVHQTCFSTRRPPNDLADVAPRSRARGGGAVVHRGGGRWGGRRHLTKSCTRIPAPFTASMASSPGLMMPSLLPSRLPDHRLTRMVSCP
jgi:hypothetical protein